MTAKKCNQDLFEEVDISVLYAKPGTWDLFEQLVDDQACGANDLGTLFWMMMRTLYYPVMAVVSTLQA